MFLPFVVLVLSPALLVVVLAVLDAPLNSMLLTSILLNRTTRRNEDRNLNGCCYYSNGGTSSRRGGSGGGGGLCSTLDVLTRTRNKKVIGVV